LQQGHTVLGVDKAPLPAVDGFSHTSVLADIRDPNRLRSVFADFRPEVVMHLAARTDLSRNEGIEGYTSNTVGVRVLLEAIQEVGTVRRAVCTSSQLVCRMGYIPKNDFDYCPTTAYGESKVETERLWREMGGGGTEWCITRPTSVWGPWMYEHYLRFFRMVAKGRYVHVGARPVLRSFGFVGNTVFQLSALALAPARDVQERVFYLADYTPIRLDDWAERFRRELGGPPIRRVPITVARAAASIGDVVAAAGIRTFPFTSFRLNNVLTDNVVNTKPIESVVGGLPFTVDDGIAQTTAWLRRVLAPSSGIRPRPEASPLASEMR
jgi:nucleoside-diphosphate-sugar epimerase